MSTKDKTTLHEMIERLGIDEFTRIVSSVISPYLKPKGTHEPKWDDDLAFHSFEIGIDHPDEYYDENRKHVLASHPYALDLNNLRAIIKFCEKRHKTVRIDTKSWYLFGQTLCVRYMKL